MRLKNQNGASLVFVLIITFVLMTIILGFAYQSRLYSLMSSSVIDSLDTRIKADSFFKSYYKGVNVGPIVIDDITYSITKGESSDSSAGDTALIDASMYNEIPIAASSQFVVHYSLGRDGKNIYSQDRLIIDADGSNAYHKYYPELTPLNVPYVDESTFLSAEQDYRLSNGRNLDGETGYIGSIQYNNTTEKIYLIGEGGVSTEINLPSSNTPIWPISEVSIGWDLKDGRWNMFLAISIKQSDNPNLEYAVYTSGTTVRNLVDSPADAVTDLSTWTKVLSSVSVSENSTVATPYRSLTWFNSSSDYQPRLFALNNDDSSNPSINTLFKVVKSFYGVPSLTLIGNYSKQGDIYPIAVRNENSFTSNKVLLAAAISGSVDEFYISDNITYRAFPSLATVHPTFILDNGEYYYLEAVDNRIAKYEFNMDDVADTGVTVKGPMSGYINAYSLYGNIKSAMVKYGLYFVSSDRLYVFSIEGLNLNEIVDNTSNFQVLVDFSKPDSQKVYGIPDGLECKIGNVCDANDRVYFNHFVYNSAVQIGNTTGVFYKRDA
jgi:hypothetical protein